MSIEDGIRRWVNSMRATPHGSDAYPEWVKANTTDTPAPARHSRVNRPMSDEERWRPPGLMATTVNVGEWGIAHEGCAHARLLDEEQRR